MHAFLDALETHLALRWPLSGHWVATGSRFVAQARAVADGAPVTVHAVFCADDGMATAQMAREIRALDRRANQPAVTPLLATGRAAGWLHMVTDGHADHMPPEGRARDGRLATAPPTPRTRSEGAVNAP